MIEMKGLYFNTAFNYRFIIKSHKILLPLQTFNWIAFLIAANNYDAVNFQYIFGIGNMVQVSKVSMTCKEG